MRCNPSRRNSSHGTIDSLRHRNSRRIWYPQSSQKLRRGLQQAFPVRRLQRASKPYLGCSQQKSPDLLSGRNWTPWFQSAGLRCPHLSAHHERAQNRPAAHIVQPSLVESAIQACIATCAQMSLQSGRRRLKHYGNSDKSANSSLTRINSPNYSCADRRSPRPFVLASRLVRAPGASLDRVAQRASSRGSGCESEGDEDTSSAAVALTFHPAPVLL